MRRDRRRPRDGAGRLSRDDSDGRYIVLSSDLATLKGFWLGNDLTWRQRLDLYPDAEAAAADSNERRRDRDLLLEALANAGLLAPERRAQFLSDSGEPMFTTELGDAIVTYLALSRARLMLVQTEDVVGEAEQANLPGTTDAYPNWRRRLSRTLDEIVGGPDLLRVAALSAEGRLRSARR
jgi:4-alpha-glucanotransferase